MKTQFAKKSDIDRKWYVVDAKDIVLGKLAVKVAVHLRGKNKPVFTPNSTQVISSLLSMPTRSNSPAIK